MQARAGAQAVKGALPMGRNSPQRAPRGLYTEVLSGTAFGKFGEGYLRLSYANSIENIQAALQKMKQVIESL